MVIALLAMWGIGYHEQRKPNCAIRKLVVLQFSVKNKWTAAERMFHPCPLWLWQPMMRHAWHWMRPLTKCVPRDSICNPQLNEMFLTLTMTIHGLNDFSIVASDTFLLEQTGHLKRNY